MSNDIHSEQRDAEAFFIGSGTGQLFAYYHRPSGPPRELGFVLCPPHGQEAVQFHRPLRLLATLLSEQGYPALRFDFRGCGDSAGDQDDWSVDHWTTDVGLALDALKERSGVSSLGLIGLRLGGHLALKAAALRGNIHALVAWDAVLDGHTYLDDALAQHENMLRNAHVRPDMDPQCRTRRELLGYALPGSLLGDLGAIKLSSLESIPARHALVVESVPDFPQDELVEHLAGLGVEVSHERHTIPQLWEWTEDFARVHVPRKILDSIGDWVSRLKE